MRFIVITSAALLSFVTPAANATDSGFYMGLGAASGNMTTCQVSYCVTFSEGAKESVHGRMVFGYDFNRFIGIEGGYADYGTYKLKAETVKAQGISLAARGGYKFRFGLSLFGKLGLSSVKTQYSEANLFLSTVGNSSRNSTGLLFGLGAQYDFNDDFAVRLISEATSFDDGGYKGAVGGLNLIGILRF